MTDYEKIKEIVTKDKEHIFKKRVHKYHLNSYVVILKYEIIQHSHIDLEVATTHFKFNKAGDLISIYTTGWY